MCWETVHFEFLVTFQSAKVQYDCNTRIFSCIAVILHLCGPLQYNAAIQVFYNLQKTCRLLAAVVKKTCIALVLCLCGLLQYNKIFVLCYCSCIALVRTTLDLRSHRPCVMTKCMSFCRLVAFGFETRNSRMLVLFLQLQSLIHLSICMYVCEYRKIVLRLYRQWCRNLLMKIITTVKVFRKGGSLLCTCCLLCSSNLHICVLFDQKFHGFGFYPRDTAGAVFATSTCPSVCPSVTRRFCA